MSTPADWFETGEVETTSQATATSRTDSVKAKAQAQREAARKKSETDQQDDALRPLEQGGQQQSFGVTFNQVSDQLYKASDVDLLDAAADLIGEVTDAMHREELGGIYRQRRAELE